VRAGSNFQSSIRIELRVNFLFQVNLGEATDPASGGRNSSYTNGRKF
jgi:hypothetical protein